MKTIELITPCYNEESCIVPFYEAIDALFLNHMKEYNWIVTYVDDGSKDNTLLEIKKLVNNYPHKNIRYISLSRNFGKEGAMYAGLSNAVGDYIAILDVDLQHPPILLLDMLSAIEKEGYDCATARRVTRKGESKVRGAFSEKFYKVFNSLTGLELMGGSTDYRLMKFEVVQAILKMNERERFTKGIYSWIGFRNKWIEYENVERINGQTKWNFAGLLRYALNSFLSFAITPLRAVVWMGLLIVLADMLWVVKILFDYFVFGIATGGGITTLTLIVLFLGGVIITILGIIGEYMARIYLEVKKRPIYISRESNIDISLVTSKDLEM